VAGRLPALRIVATLASAGFVALTCAAGGAHASSVTPPYQQPVPVTSWTSGAMGATDWMIKANDLALLPAGYGRWSWVMCGSSVFYGAESLKLPQPPFTSTTDDPCSAGQVRTYTSYWSLLSAVKRHAAGRTVVFDPEYWNLTPAAEQRNEAKYLRLGCQAARKAGIYVIATPNDAAGNIDADYKAAATYCSVVEIQSQQAELYPGKFRSKVGAFYKLVTKIKHPARMMIGLASDPGGQVATATDLEAAYTYARSLGITRAWLNIDPWEPPAGDGTGDASVAVAFLAWVEAHPKPVAHAGDARSG
jgi:hypothetical protein